MEENHRYYREGHLASASAPSRHLAASLRYFLSAPLHVAAAAAVAGTACGRRVCPLTILDSDAKERGKEGRRARGLARVGPEARTYARLRPCFDFRVKQQQLKE